MTCGEEIDINAIKDYNDIMKSLNIRNIEDAVYLKIKTIAATKGRSMEAELRDIVTKAASQAPMPRNVGRSIQQRFAGLGGVELEFGQRSPQRALPDFDA